MDHSSDIKRTMSMPLIFELLLREVNYHASTLHSAFLFPDHTRKSLLAFTEFHEKFEVGSLLG
jgi:hypothetical protein